MAPSISWQDIDSIPTGFIPLEEVERLRSAGWDASPSGMGTEYRKNWNLWHSAREYVQNSLDAVETCVIAVDRNDRDGRKMTLVLDDGPGFPVQAMRLGQRKGSTQVKVDEAAAAEAERQKVCLRGRFGEGMKLGVIPVLRAGGRVFIRTVGFDATFVDSEISLLGERSREVLLLLRRNNVTRGTAVAIEGLDATDYEGEDLRRKFLPTLAAQDSSIVLHTTPRGGAVQPQSRYERDSMFEARYACVIRQLLDPEKQGGSIFLRDIFVQKIEGAVFGYNLWFYDAIDAVGSDRDRFQLTPTDYRLLHEIGQILASAPESLLVDYFRRVSTAGEQSFEWKILSRLWYYSDDAPVRFVSDEASARIFRATSTVLGTDRFSYADNDQGRKILEHDHTLNMEDRLPQGIYHLLVHKRLVRTPEQIRGKLSIAERFTLTTRAVERLVRAAAPEADRYEAVKGEAMQAVLAAYRRVESRFNDLAEVMVGRKVPVSFYVDLNDDDMKRVAAFYSPENGGSIHIKIQQLNRGAALRALIHECSHARHGADDLTDSFVTDLERSGELLAAYAAAHRAWWDGLVEALSTLENSYFIWRGTVTGKGQHAYTPRDSDVETLPYFLFRNGMLYFTGTPSQ